MTIRLKSRPKGVAVAGVVDVVGGASRGRHCVGLVAPSVATAGAAELAKKGKTCSLCRLRSVQLLTFSHALFFFSHLIIFSLLAHTDLDATPDKGLLLADLVQNCSFTFTNWQHVQSHHSGHSASL